MKQTHTQAGIQAVTNIINSLSKLTESELYYINGSVDAMAAAHAIAESKPK